MIIFYIPIPSKKREAVPGRNWCLKKWVSEWVTDYLNMSKFKSLISPCSTVCVCQNAASLNTSNFVYNFIKRTSFLQASSRPLVWLLTVHECLSLWVTTQSTDCQTQKFRFHNWILQTVNYIIIYLLVILA